MRACCLRILSVFRPGGSGKACDSGKAWRQRESLTITGKPGVPERKRGRDADSIHERIDQDLI